VQSASRDGDQAGKSGLDGDAPESANPAPVCPHISPYGHANERRPGPGYPF
jgi:hypothetical protein